jgi:hypothetical protein
MRNLALLPADLAASRVCSNPQTKTLSPDLTRHSHEATSRSIRSTSSRMILWGVSTMRLICARSGSFSSPARYSRSFRPVQKKRPQRHGGSALRPI